MTRDKLLIASGIVLIPVSMANSAWDELIEWWSAILMDQDADKFHGLQGDPWDTQSGMFFAFIGALTALLLFSRLHDRQIARMNK